MRMRRVGAVWVAAVSVWAVLASGSAGASAPERAEAEPGAVLLQGSGSPCSDSGVVDQSDVLRLTSRDGIPVLSDCI